jgi:hypothetical protein
MAVLEGKVSAWLARAGSRLGSCALLRDRGGNVTILVAVALPLILGSVGLGTEAAFLMLKRQQIQKVADAAAYSAAVAYRAGSSNWVTQARAIASADGFVDGSGGVSVAVSKPPTMGPNTGDNYSIEVIVTTPQNASFSKIFGFGNFNVKARAVARTGSGGSGNGCALALNGSVASAANIAANSNLTLNGCNMYVDSSSPTAFTVASNSSLTTGGVYVVGGASVWANSTVSPSPSTGVISATDPYASVDPQVPTHSSCSSSSITAAAAPSTVYCSLSVLSNASYTIPSGISVLYVAQISIASNAALSGTGVTIVVTSTQSTGGTYGYIDINSNSSINLTAPTTGATKGIAIMQDRNAPASTYNNSGSCQTNCNNVIASNHDATRGIDNNIIGAIYTPRQALTYSSNNASDVCTQLVADTLQFNSNVTLNASCNNAGTTPIGGSNTATALIE